MKIKKIFAVILAIIMIFLCACGKSGENTNSATDAPATTQSAAPIVTEAPAEESMQDILDALSTTEFKSAKNVILFMGDGMGNNHVPATDEITGGRYNGKLAFEYLPVVNDCETLCVPKDGSSEPDSASGGTGLACGFKSTRSLVGMDYKKNSVKNLCELCKELGKSSGVITSESIIDATPATFTVHTDNRHEEEKIAGLQITDAAADIIMGGGRDVYDSLFKNDPSFKDKLAENNVTYTTEWKEVQSFGGEGRLIATLTGDYWDDVNKMTPTLAEMTSKSIEVLSKNEKGFFLMVEGGALDEAAHTSDLVELTRQMIAFDEAVEVGLRFAMKDKDTVIIVTADHNTGALLPKAEADEVIANVKGSAARFVKDEKWCLENAEYHSLLEAEKIAQEKHPETDISALPYRFTTIKHVNDSVKVYAVGYGVSELNASELKTFQIGKLMGKLLGDAGFGAADENGKK